MDSGLEECLIDFEEDGMDGADCADTEQDDSREQVSLRASSERCQLILYQEVNSNI